MRPNPIARVGRQPAGIGAVVLAVVMLAAGCGSGPDGADGPSTASRRVVVTDVYPTTFAVQQVVGDDVEVIQLAPAGVEPHDYELTPSQVAQAADADLVMYLPGLVPAVADAVAQVAADRGVDVSAGIARLAADGSPATDPATSDPHVWLDPANMAAMGRTAAAALTRAGISADATALTEAMTGLDHEASQALAACAITPMVVSHEAFGYLAAAHGFEQIGISGLSPEAEPSPRRMADIATLVRDRGVTTIYFESLASPAAAQAIAAETGAATALLDPIEGNTGDAGYEALMRANVAALRAGQACS